MRPGPIALALLFALAAAGCSRHDSADVGQDLKSAGHDVSHEAGKIGHDPDVKAAGAELKAAGHDIALDLRRAGSQAKSAAHDVGNDARRAGHDASNDARRDTHNDHGSKNDS